MNNAQILVTILTLKESENEKGDTVFTGKAKYSWSTGGEPGCGILHFYCENISEVPMLEGESYVFFGHVSVRKTPLESGCNNTSLHINVLGFAIPPAKANTQATAPAPKTTATKTKFAATPKATAKTKTLTAAGVSNDLDDIYF